MRKKNKKKIVHIITSLRQGGAQRVLCELIASTKNDFDHQRIINELNLIESANKYLTQRLFC